MRCDARKGSVLLVSVLVLSLTLPAAAGALAPGVGATFASGETLVTDVKAKGKAIHVNKSVKVNKTVKVNKNVYVNNKNVKVHKNVYVNNKNVYVKKNVVVARPYKVWVRKPYYGTYVSGVALGTILALSAIPPAPAPNLCWYWANQAHTRGYWDYCY